MTATEFHLLHDPSRPAWDGSGDRPIRVHLWRPKPADSPPDVVLLSHGTGGAAQNLTWLATALADAGFLVAGVDHHGNTFVDQYRPQAFVCWWDRPLDLRYLLDRLSVSEEIGSVGAAGFSLGGYSVAALLGARVLPARFAAIAHGDIESPPTPEYPTLLAELRAAVTEEEQRQWLDAVGRDYTDPRVGAGFLICPSLGAVLDPGSLAAITRPTRVWLAEADEIVPASEVARCYAEPIPAASLRRATGRVGHYAFLGGGTARADATETPAAAATRSATETTTAVAPTGAVDDGVAELTAAAAATGDLGALTRRRVAADAVDFFQGTLRQD
ncbi:hypothetical protein JQS43_10035 [Natronosporangium hydrolyticum]|uniref:Serine aminopeptidase S33 domain-containing protein n=1 Tax=Natronosporangium hydrolyticum TaxID=2811111 RepID=A0A895YFI7_9ACTN|nr:hypothetical protein [Natronosporangium hydrolyticum]QSB16577.1 hypothetical protein JQS43_10035 [Natronosporangium hydrolyticum]